MRDDVVLAVRGVRKSFGTLVAVDDVDLELHAGEIHALVGENGAGKSTLAALAYGGLRPDGGSIVARGEVGLVRQHFQLAGRLRVWENVLLGREPRRGWRLDANAARERVRELGDAHGLAVDPDARVDELPIGIRQRVELLRELAREPAILLLDEPTAALAPGEIAAFFATVRGLAERGTAVLVVTHKLQEVLAYCRRVTVLRAGRVTARFEAAATSAGEIARAMVGGELPRLAPRLATTPRPCLELANVDAAGAGGVLVDANLGVGAGEIVGIAGIEGNGQSALADAVAGTLAHRGRIAVDGLALPSADVRARLTCGLRTIPQDRQAEALVGSWTVAENAALGRHRTPPLRRGLALDRAALARDALAAIERFDLRPADPHAIVGTLSGGNQQKLVAARALAGAPRVVVAYQPTRGIDVGAATLVHSRLIEARNAGTAVLLISFELDEIFALADRIAVVHAGRLVGLVPAAEADRGRIGALMTGAA